jgi:hypothetical protein
VSLADHYNLDVLYTGPKGVGFLHKIRPFQPVNGHKLDITFRFQQEIFQSGTNLDLEMNVA